MELPQWARRPRSESGIGEVRQSTKREFQDGRELRARRLLQVPKEGVRKYQWLRWSLLTILGFRLRIGPIIEERDGIPEKQRNENAEHEIQPDQPRGMKSKEREILFALASSDVRDVKQRYRRWNLSDSEREPNRNRSRAAEKPRERLRRLGEKPLCTVHTEVASRDQNDHTKRNSEEGYVKCLPRTVRGHEGASNGGCITEIVQQSQNRQEKPEENAEAKKIEILKPG
jgi:hypothetical protein